MQVETVGDLIDELEQFDRSKSVRFAYEYGDRSRSVVAKKITTVDEGFVVHSDYFRSELVVEENEKENDEKTRVILIQ